MYFLYKLDDSQIEMIVNEDTFLKVVDKDFMRMINFFNQFETESSDFFIHPETKREAEWMIEAYCRLTSLSQLLPKWLTHYYYCSFSRILSGVNPANALGLVNPSHRPKESYIAERNKEIFNDVTSLMEKGLSLFEASLDVSEKFDLHESNIQKIYSAVKKSFVIQSDIKIPF